MAETRRALVEMGFSAGKIEAAIRNTSGTLEDAVTWLEELQNRPTNTSTANLADDPNSAFAFEKESAQSNTTNTTTTASDSSTTPADESSSSETQSNNTSTPEPIPLTAEEREARLAVLREKAALRRAEKEKELAKEQRQNDVIRKKRDQESINAMEELQRKEAAKEAQKRRQQAREDAAAKQRIKDLIEADKRARAAAKKANSSAEPSTTQSSTTQAQPKPAANRPPPTDTKIRLRAENAPPGGAKAFAFPVDTVLGEVAVAAVRELGLDYDPALVVFVSNFPRKEYGVNEFPHTIQELNLLNSSLVVKRR
ncbi:uncharacterized protein SAPINGB_P000876 [Magnusiomyces paraingens]|uniref:UBA domain-containing protein n=1 Tax=Magnusiomyces paraingens TaxID=2606893 RepID=A0A5E8B913_9ASCO|nr:uncharacterized protein SAPINGB_P000876 [Saprochaete ingens]VVT45758.1 unnamed protein product [Saprochaete ingens]